MLSLIIGVILDNFANIGSDNKPITVEQLEEFREVWLKYDPKGTYVVPSHNLLAILQQLRQPLGIADRHPAFSRGAPCSPPSRAGCSRRGSRDAASRAFLFVLFRFLRML